MIHPPPFSTSRRTFLKQSVGALAAPFAAPLILADTAKGANEKLNLAWVGFGNQGGGDLKACSNGHHVVALCDCDPNMWPKKKAMFPQAKFYKDFRQMLEEMGDKIDAVGIGTPDHTHFAITYMAMNMGKHVFVQKPLVHSIWQARTLKELAVEKNLVTQMGNQGHAFEGARLIKEWYEAGLIGEVREVITWTDRPKAGWGFKGTPQTAFPAAQPLPEGMDWDIWMGPVEKKVHFSKELHPTTWRPWWDFGCGGLGDIGCHTIDTAYWALGLDAPESVDVEMHDKVNAIHTPNGSVVSFNFPARNGKPPVVVKWYEGPTMPKAPEGMDWDMPGHGGFLMVGEKGGIFHPGMRPDSPRLYPKQKWDDYRANKDQQVPKTIPRTKGIHRDWTEAVVNGTKACSDFSYSAPLTEAVLLGSLAIRTGKGLKWDPAKLEISDNPDAAALINPPAREGWRPEDLA